MNQSISQLPTHEIYSTYETYKDENFHFHNLNGPAIIEQDGVRFYDHGEEWTDEQYKEFIHQKIKEIHPQITLEDYPLSYLESIVMVTNGWVRRKPPANEFTKLFREVIRQEDLYLKETENRKYEYNNPQNRRPIYLPNHIINNTDV